MQSVGQILAIPPEAWPDTTRPNVQGGATPHRVERDDDGTLTPMARSAPWDVAEGWPVYRVTRTCPRHGPRRGFGFRPQYDDDATPQVPCDACMDVADRRRAEEWRREGETRKDAAAPGATGTRSRRPRDPLAEGSH